MIRDRTLRVAPEMNGPSRLGRYELVRLLREEPRFYLAAAVAETPALGGKPLLIGVARRPGHAMLLQRVWVLSRLGCSVVPSLLDIGHDERSDLDYYVLELPPVGAASLLSPQSSTEDLPRLRAVAEAIGVAHRDGLAYRNFDPAAFLSCESKVFLYDLSRAAAIRPDGTVPALQSTLPFDPPEAARDRYQGVPGDILGFGTLLKPAVPPGGPLAALVERMTDHEPRRRPASMDEVLSSVDWT